MPTTLTLDDNLSALLSAAARQRGKPVTDLAIGLLQAALARPDPAPASPEPFRIRPHNGVFVSGVPLQKLGRFADELDTQALLARHTL